MRFRTKPATTARTAKYRARVCLRRAGFTLAEVLAALALMAIVVPVAIHGLRVASLAGEVAQRKSLAARLGDRLLTENIVAHQWNQTVQTGVENQGPYQFRWTIRNNPWNGASRAAVNGSSINASAIHELSADVAFTVQNQNHLVHLSTLIDTSQQ